MAEDVIWATASNDDMPTMKEEMQMISIRWGRKKGFSILELMFAMAIFLTSFCMIIGVFPVTFRSIQTAKNNLVATHLAELNIEVVKNLAYDEIVTGKPADGTYSLRSTVNGVQQNLDYNCNYVVTPLGINDDLKEVRVQVSWNEGSMVHYVNLVTRVARLQ
jgi:prepilin-type N-terminal cleavage/methylation domain-containing protein